MRALFFALIFSLSFAPAAYAAELYAVQPVTPGNTVVYPKRLKVLREVLPSLREKATAGDAEAQRNLGEKLLMLDERADALNWLKKSADHGNADALYLLGYLALEAKKTDEAAAWFEKAAAAGNSHALVELGNIYWRYRNDPAKSFPFYKRGAEAGNAEAQNYLAICYANGWGVKKNVKKALELLKKSAGNGFSEPMMMLYEIYSDPQPAKLVGEKTNPAKAVYWLERATAARTGSALLTIFELMEQGKGQIQPDASRGLLWSLWALDAVQNHDTENIYYGKNDLEKKVALFSQRLTPEERTKAENIFREWIENGYPVLSATEPE